jgi:NADPH:quinone reductase-like Zn-dependent oxidoreductase
MKAYQINGTNGFDSLKLAELPAPLLLAGEVSVRIHAVSLNYRDYMNVMGIKGVTGPVPRIPCSDGAGEVLAVGEGVTEWQVGERVVMPFMPSWLSGGFEQRHSAQALGGAVDGVLREQITVKAESLLRLPERYSYEQGATFPCAAVTAWQALAVRGKAKAGESVLVLGSGGVSTWALQLAQLMGCRVLAVTSSSSKAEQLMMLGASAVYDYSADPNWEDWVLAQTQGVGVDHVVEIGGAGTLNRSIKAVRFGGHIALIGVLTGVSGEVQTVGLLRKGITLSGVYVGSRAMFADLLQFADEHALYPQIDSTYAFADAVAAFQRMESAKHMGKIVIRVGN